MSKVADRQHAVNGIGEDPGEVAAGAARTAAGAAFSALVEAVFRLNGRLVAAGDALAAPAGLTSARWQVLAAVEDAPASVADVARTLGNARQSVQRVADVLAEEGLCAWAPNPAHQRAKLLVLTEAGRDALARVGARQATWANGIGERVGEASLREAAATLRRAIEALGQ